MSGQHDVILQAKKIELFFSIFLRIEKKNEKKFFLSVGRARACLNGPILGRDIFFECNNHQYLLDIIAVYHNMQNQRKLMIQTRENGRKPPIWAILGPFCQILGQDIFFSKIRLRHFLSFMVL